MRLIHYSSKRLGEVYSTEQAVPSSYQKPCGLWVSATECGTDEDWGWKEWCIAETFMYPERFQHAYEIVLKPDANILYLQCGLDIDLFTEKYSILDDVIGHISPRFRAIDWPRVAQEYQGIIIAPYIHSRRMADHTYWYYGWDCSSGCIWDKDVIESVKEVVEPKRMFREVEE